MLYLLNIALTALPYLAFGWLLARDPSFDSMLGPQGTKQDSIIAAFTWGGGFITLFLVGAAFTAIILLIGASGWGVLLGIAGGLAIAGFGQGRL
ncbi:MAG: hypothetical protein J2P50_06415 [Hyphomicrobiaceae bacterium]|nr:hypothetical protein [Hyphomicrobiaceae bacterium]